MCIVFIDLVHILSSDNRQSHSNFHELDAKIPALGGKASENNGAILRYIALNGPSLPYDVHKALPHRSIRYSTVNRRVRDLLKREYLAAAGKRATQRGKQEEETMYGLTWRGFVASLSVREVRDSLFQVLEKNPLLTFPEKDSILVILKEIFSEEELATISKSMFEAYLKVIPNIELIKDENLWTYVFAIRPPSSLKNVKLSKMPEDVWELLDRPAILQVAKEKIIPYVRRKKTQLEDLFKIWVILDELGAFVSKLKVEDEPSKMVKEYLEALSEAFPKSGDRALAYE